MPKKKEDIKICSKCKNKEKINNFYVSNSKLFSDGRVNICKTCLQSLIDIKDVGSLKEILRLMDKPYVEHIWKKCLEKQKPIGNYFKLISSLHQYKNCGWDVYEDKNRDSGSVKVAENIGRRSNDVKNKINEINVEELREKWGSDFDDDEILKFEKEYQRIRNSYDIKTEMHQTFLMQVCIAKVRLNEANAKKNVGEAEKWAKQFRDMATAGKLQPNQMSQSDLNGGLDTFSQLVKQVEETVDIVKILPKFKKHPRDQADFIIYCYINYGRRLNGLPKVEYDDVYKFYEKSASEYEKFENQEDDELENEFINYGDEDA